MGRLFDQASDVDYSVHEASSQNVIVAWLTKPFGFLIRVWSLLSSYCKHVCVLVWRICLQRLLRYILHVLKRAYSYTCSIFERGKSSYLWRMFNLLKIQTTTKSCFCWDWLRFVFLNYLLKGMIKIVKCLKHNFITPLVPFLTVTKSAFGRYCIRLRYLIYAHLYVLFVSYLKPISQKLVLFRNTVYLNTVEPLIANCLRPFVRTVYHKIFKLCTRGTKAVSFCFAHVLTPLARYSKKACSFCCDGVLIPVGREVALPFGRFLFRAANGLFFMCVRVSESVGKMVEAVNMAYVRYKKKYRVGVIQQEYVLNVPEGQLITRRKLICAVMDDGQFYSIHLQNDNSWHANCYLSVDGQTIGTFRLRPYSEYVLNRPPVRTARFCFLQENAKLAAGERDESTGIVHCAQMNGIIEAKMIPCFPVVKEKATTIKEKSAIVSSPSVNVANLSVNLELWDTAGQERFQGLAPMYYRGADAAIVFYSITQGLGRAEEWIKEVQKHNPSTKLFLAGNKTDLEEQRRVSLWEGQALATQYNIPLFEISAATNSQVSELFRAVAEGCRKTAFINQKGETACRLKVCLVGESGVGKTSTHDRFIHRQFSRAYKCTIGASFAVASVPVQNAQVDYIKPSNFKNRRQNITTMEGRNRTVLSNAPPAIEDKEEENSLDTISGATAFRGVSHQKFAFAEKLQEAPDQTVTLRLVLLLKKQYHHQLKLEEIFLNHMKFPKSASNIIGEYVYTHSVLDAY